MTVREASVGHYHPLLGTNVEVRVVAEAPTADDARHRARRAEDAAVARMVALQRVFSVFDPGSELSRWRRGDLAVASPELTEVLAAAALWWRLSGGAFHPATGPLRARWLRAEAEGEPPSDGELAELAAGLRELPYEIAPGGAVRIGDCTGVDLNAIAKGYIVDRAVEVAAACEGVVDALVNAGGDLRHTGVETVDVVIENPCAPTGPPLDRVALGEGAVATGGPAHRGFTVGSERHGHVIDPRTAHPVRGRPSTSVRAADAMTADAVATVAGVLTWPEALDLLAGLPTDARPAVLALSADGEVLRSPLWPQPDSRTNRPVSR